MQKAIEELKGKQWYHQRFDGSPLYLDFIAEAEIKKAAAIVTNEGGITCHAAIVSRELGIPCIIGTKIATEVLKDGDMVEVNANHGVVTVIKRA